MRTVREVSKLTGVSVRTLQHYDNIGLLRPSSKTDAGWRLYADSDLVRLQQILLFRELEFPLKDIERILASPDFDQRRALEQQIALLKLKREHLENLIALAEAMRKDEDEMTFDAFDTTKIDEYEQKAKEAWGDTAAWQEYEVRRGECTREDEMAKGARLMGLFKPFHEMLEKGLAPDAPEAIEAAKRIQDFISDNFYTCTDEIFEGLGRAYGAGGEMAANIDTASGEGTAAFAARAIEAYLLMK